MIHVQLYDTNREYMFMIYMIYINCLHVHTLNMVLFEIQQQFLYCEQKHPVQI